MPRPLTIKKILTELRPLTPINKPSLSPGVQLKLSDVISVFRRLPAPNTPLTETDIEKGEAPEIEFRYNFFVPDESVDDQGRAARAIKNPQPLKKPRYIRFSIPYASQVSPTTKGALNSLDRIFPRDARDQIVPSITNDASVNRNALFATLNFQDLNVNTKLYNLVQTSARKKILVENKRVKKEVDAERDAFALRAFQSQNDLVRSFRKDAKVEDSFLEESLNQIEMLDESYIDKDEERAIVEDNFNSVKKVAFSATMNAKFIGSIMQTGARDPLGTFAEELLPGLASAKSYQQAAIENYNPFDDGNHDLSFKALPFVGDSRELTSSSERKLNTLSFFHAGYLVEKNEVKPDGSIVRRDIDFGDGFINVLSNPRRKNFIDYDVAYGRTYTYSFAALYIVETPVEILDKNGKATSPRTERNQYFLVKSSASPAVSIATIEKVPPRPPENLKIVYDNAEKAPLIMWDHPFNKQRDVKRFQVLRRKTIQDPFELIVEYDFDNSEVRYDSIEKVTPNLRIKIKNPTFYHFDSEFKKDETWIYTLRSVDAHGLTSDYSEQLETKFNRFSNKIDVRLISTRGAPAQMPNAKLINRLFTPTIKDSNHRRVKIYFDPEYLQLYEDTKQGGLENKRDLNLFEFAGSDEGRSRKAAKYKLQILNVDLQQSKIIDIVISDKRSD
jgi:hypothetical protein